MQHFKISRNPNAGKYKFTDIFQGLENATILKQVFSPRLDVRRILDELVVEVIPGEGYMHINEADGTLVVSLDHLLNSEERILYLDAIHELVHLRQRSEGKALFDETYGYVDRPTEIEAYEYTVQEARRIGMPEKEIEDYLMVEWISKHEHQRLVRRLGLHVRRRS